MRTAAGKVVLWDAGTGKQGEYWPIDARAMVKAGSHVESPPDGATVTAPAMPPRTVGAPVPAVAQLPIADPAQGDEPATPKRQRKASPQAG